LEGRAVGDLEGMLVGFAVGLRLGNWEGIFVGAVGSGGQTAIEPLEATYTISTG
jgi:hypothetical protein